MRQNPLMRPSMSSLMRSLHILFVLCPTGEHLQDAEALRGLGLGHDVLAVNKAIADYPHDLCHAATLHGDLLEVAPGRTVNGYPQDWPGWLAERRERKYPGPKDVHATQQYTAVDRVWRFDRPVPSSGYLGIAIGKGLGYSTIITNAQLSHHCERYQRYWASAAQRGLLSNVYYWAPHTDSAGKSFVAGILFPFFEEAA